jgi:hypothetical protein
MCPYTYSIFVPKNNFSYIGQKTKVPSLKYIPQLIVSNLGPVW